MGRLFAEEHPNSITMADSSPMSLFSFGEQQYRGIFTAVGEALLIYTLDGRLMECNPAALRMYGYSLQEFQMLEADELIHPDSLPHFAHFGDTIRSGQEFRSRGINLRKDGTTFTGEVLGTPFLYQGRPHILAVVRDISDEVALMQQLESRVEERTRQLAALLEISRNVTATLELPRILALVLEQLSQVVEYGAAGILTLDNGMFQVRAYRGPVPLEEILKIRYPANQAFDLQVITSRQPFIIPDIQADTPDAQAFREIVGEYFDSQYRHVRTWMRVPLIVKERVIGILALHHSEPDRYARRESELALAFANQSAVAIDNARLFADEQRRAEQFRVISALGQRITSILDINDLTNQTVRLIQDAFGYHHVHIGLVKDDQVYFAASAGMIGQEASSCCDHIPIRVGLDGISGRVAATGQPILVADVRQDDRVILLQEEYQGSALVVPLKVQGQVIGVLEVESDQIGAFDQSDVTVLQSLADQVAVAVENARLYEQGRQLASLEERQKLARELHDSVSQALYGIALGARTARTLLEREPVLDAGKSLLTEPLDYTLSLADAALSEMRALIFELRPESLQQEGLVAALTKQADSLRARYRLDVVCTLGDEPEVSLEAKESLYRVAQEAMHNVVKHARARQVHLELGRADGHIRLRICDDGIGFDTRASFPGHLGLQSMRERVSRLGGVIEITSQPAKGTCVQAWLPVVIEAISTTQKGA